MPPSFNGAIGSWDTSSVTTMADMFNGASTFNKDVSKWNTGKVTRMYTMFRGATSFNQDISKWSTASVSNMEYMFSGATSFNRDLSSWNVGNVGYKCFYFEANTGATWTLPKPALPDGNVSGLSSASATESRSSAPVLAVGDTADGQGRRRTTKRDRQRTCGPSWALPTRASWPSSCTSERDRP